MHSAVRDARGSFALPLGLVAAMWLVEAANLLTHNALDGLGIRPRTLPGLWGIAFSPFLHANLAHLVANTVPCLVLGWLVALRGPREFVLVTGLVMALGGAAVWLLGGPFSVYIGASGLVFGYLGFLLARGFFERSLLAIVLSMVALLLYGGALWGMLPAVPGVARDAHLYGFLAGILAGDQLSHRARVKAGHRANAPPTGATGLAPHTLTGGPTRAFATESLKSTPG